jgi:PhnB protein
MVSPLHNAKEDASMAVKPIPDGYHSVTPYLLTAEAARLIDFLKQAFAAEEHERVSRPDGAIMHAEVRIGDSVVMMGEPMPPLAPMPASLHVYVPDVDAVYQRALRAGATSVMEPADQFYGDRSGGVKDPFGNLWWIGTHKEDVPPDELARRARAYMEQQR